LSGTLSGWFLIQNEKTDIFKISPIFVQLSVRFREGTITHFVKILILWSGGGVMLLSLDPVDAGLTDLLLRWPLLRVELLLTAHSDDV